MNFISTLKGSLLEGFFPKGWDLEKIDKCAGSDPATILDRQPFWHKEFNPVPCADVKEFSVFMGHSMACQIRDARLRGEQLAMILPVGPMGMYRWVVYFLKEWGVSADHVHCFNMDEWSDDEGNNMAEDTEGSFKGAMEQAFYGPLGELTVPESQRNYATRKNLPTYPEKIAKLKKEGAKLILVFGVGRVMHIAFWEPHFAQEFDSVEEWKKQPYRLGAKLHPLTIEQNSITSFKSRTTLVPCFANTVGPGLFLQADYIIGGCDGALSRGMQWQGMSLWTTLRYSPDMWIPSSFIPTMAGRLYFLEELAGPLNAECN